MLTAVLFCLCVAAGLPDETTMSARSTRRLHGPSSQQQQHGTGRRAAADLAAMESLLDKFAASTCHLNEWAQEKDRTTEFMALVKTVQYIQRDWPPWLLSKLTAALSRALQRDVLGLSGPDPANSFVFEPFGVGNLNKKWVVVDALVSLGQLLSSLARLYRCVLIDTCSAVAAPVVAPQHIITQQGEHVCAAPHGCSSCMLVGSKPTGSCWVQCQVVPRPHTPPAQLLLPWNVVSTRVSTHACA